MKTMILLKIDISWEKLQEDVSNNVKSMDGIEKEKTYSM